MGIQKQRVQAIAMADGAARTGRSVAAEYDGRVRLLHGLGVDRYILELVIFAVEFDLFLGP